MIGKAHRAVRGLDAEAERGDESPRTVALGLMRRGREGKRRGEESPRTVALGLMLRGREGKERDEAMNRLAEYRGDEDAGGWAVGIYYIMRVRRVVEMVTGGTYAQ